MADADFPSDFEREARRHERAVDEHRRREELEAEVERLGAEVERLRADRAALLDHWILKADRQWHFCGAGLMPQAFATREDAEEAVLKWARSLVR
jgi:tmRNA-binding protein